ncbi:hypothetical protein E3Q03_02621 [Wallemia mellicola]|uniref:protein-histidine N-methyltransferase n=1 Tax=Wallemia mellicola TaxID=1708541 RepID=A0A4V4N127_9BASI|nr:hypothetical protein E3Q05_02093 [Wallemia mellicola]TIC61678.1 hypothetical protein E3Q03_02621 [Wallemia mellicola]TIC65461.1 hypothetical protein E3Q01_02157 [Wallemia mellicola]
MTFSFGFQLDDDNQGVTTNTTTIDTNVDESLHPWTDIKVEDLISQLPPLLSYSSVDIPHSSITPIARRDLFDARFQLIDADEDQAIISGDSDLIPGKYEGGLKTWECSVDLVQHLHQCQYDFREKKLLEIGCGTSLPSLYAYRSMLEQSGQKNAVIHFQDYNLQTIQLVTFPNIFLTWYITQFNKGPEGEIEINETIIEQFKQHLRDVNIELRFSYGAWKAINEHYDYIFTSETVYRTASIPTLVELIESSTHKDTITLIASKSVYFGVGGGVREFSDYVTSKGHSVDPAWSSKGSGVVRHILSFKL